MFDFWSKIKGYYLFFLGKFSSEEIENQYNLIKMLLAEPENYRDAINAINKDIAFMPVELKNKLDQENIILWMNREWHTLWSLIFENN